jgi:TetR/AcrR family transcriptional repressor of mexJK operon
MKEWPEDHPKAKAMARKRAVILAAAKAAFLDSGYAGTSMDAIAQAAGVSLMTLYRHAESKDDLFAAVITGACAPNDAVEQREFEGLLSLPLDEVLRLSAIHMQEVLARTDTIALMRTVIAEAATFPHLTELAYRGFIVHFEEFSAYILAQKVPAMPAAQAATLGQLFVERVIGGNLLRALLGRPSPSDADMHRRAEFARDDVLRALAASHAILT